MAAGSGTVTIRILGDAKSALKSFGEVGTGADGLGGKLKGIGTAALATGAVVGTAVVAIGAELFKIGESFDEQYDKIRVGTGATGDALESLKNDFRNVVQDVPTDFGKASDAITKLVQVTGIDAGPALDKLAEQFLELSRITKTDLTANLDAGAKALMNFNVPVDQYSSKLDELFRATQLTGVSFEDLTGQLSESGVQLQALGFDFDQATTVIAGLGKAGLSVSDVLPALSKAMAVGAKEGKSAQDVYQGLFRAIKDAPDDVAASAIAFDTLGAKAGPKFAALIREGKFAFDSLGETIREGQDTIIGAGKDTQDFSEKWLMFKNKVLVWLEPLAAKVFDGLGKAMDALPGIIDSIIEKFNEFKPTLTSIADVISSVLAPIIAFLTDHWEQLKVALIAIAIVIGTVVVALVAMQAAIELLVFVITGIWLTAIVKVVEGLQWLWEKSEGIRQIAGEVASVIAGTLVSSFQGWVTAISTVTGWLQALWEKSEGLRAFFADAFAAGIGVLKGAFDQLRGAVDWLWSSIDRVISAAQSAIGFVSDLASMGGLGNTLEGTIADIKAKARANAPGTGGAGRPVIQGATGFAGTLHEATLGLFGEGSGPEDVLAIPHSMGGIFNRGGSPNSAMGGNSPTYVINVSTMDARGVEEKVIDALTSIERRDGRLPLRSVR